MSVHSSQSRDCLVSVRCVVADHYQAEPVAGLDPLVSDFTGYNIRKVPIIRVFGCTLAGQRSCLHVHGIFPYLYVPLPGHVARGDTGGWVYRLAASLDRAINISMGQGRAAVQHVYKAVVVTGLPMYGYHPRQHSFVKIYLYNPHLVRRAAELLQGGAVMDTVLQPHESHTNHVLQWMMDYNLQGMNPIHLSHALFRQGRLRDEYDDMEPVVEVPWRKARTRGRHPSLDSSLPSQTQDAGTVLSSYLSIPPGERLFCVEDMAECLKLPAEVSCQSTSELELDAVAADIINHQDVTGAAMNPGLVALWEDERLRRAGAGISDPLTPPSSPPRPAKAALPSESEVFWKGRLETVIQEKLASDTASAPADSSDPDATLNIERQLRGPVPVSGSVYPAETSDQELPLLPAATQLHPHVASLSDSLLNATGAAASSSARSNVSSVLSQSSYGDDTIVDEEFILSQIPEADSDDDLDGELVDILADLVTDAREEKKVDGAFKTPTPIKSPEEMCDDNHFKTPKSQKSSSDSQGSGRKVFKEESELLEEEDLETLEMSQVVWDTEIEEENWDELDKTLMEEVAKTLPSASQHCDMEDMFN